ncbi:MAG TPA: winged helix-turn-helix domain-containing protein, partial [Myxococcota bacterium]|nr:winged helix-turn-helix domain-containing protein [Myxococcota bacterium]
EIAWELAGRATTVVSRDALSRAARGVAYDGLDRGIDIHVSRLRKKLREAGLSELTIRSIRGEGYLLTQGSD